MTEQEQFESELRQLRPAKLPEELYARLQALDRATVAPSRARSSAGRTNPGLSPWLRWLIPATAMILITGVIWRHQLAPTTPMPETRTATASAPPPLLKADNIEIGKELVSSFDAVATLPSGEPVRFRVQQWMDQVVVDDKSQGLLVESRMPRVVVVPVRFETY